MGTAGALVTSVERRDRGQLRAEAAALAKALTALSPEADIRNFISAILASPAAFFAVTRRRFRPALARASACARYRSLAPSAAEARAALASSSAS